MEVILKQHDEFGDDADSNEVTKTVADVIIYSLIIHIPLIIISTIAIIVTFTRIKVLHTPDNIPILALSIADLFLGIIFTPTTLYTHFNTLETAIDCILSIPVRYFLCELIMSMVSILAAERAISIYTPFMYVEIVTIKRIVFCILGLVLFDLCIFIGVCGYYLISNQDYKKHGFICNYINIPTWLSIFMMVISAVKLFGTVFCTFYVVHRARRSLRKLNKVNIELSQAPGNTRDHHNAKIRKSSKSLLSLTCVFLGAFLPPLVLPLIYKYAQPPANTRDILLGICAHFLLINATIDTLVYAVSRRTYRLAFKFFLTNPPWRWHQFKSRIRIQSTVSRYLIAHGNTSMVQFPSPRYSFEWFNEPPSPTYQFKSEIDETSSKMTEITCKTPFTQDSSVISIKEFKEPEKKQKRRVTIYID